MPQKTILAVLGIIIAICCLAPAHGAAQTVSLPITVDYPLLRKLLVKTYFTGSGESATLVNEGSGCIYLSLSSPQVSEVNGRMRLELRVSARAGTPFRTQCFSPLEWNGYIAMLQQPVISADTWQLSFHTVGSQLLGANRQPVQMASLLWNIMEPHINSYISSIRINLMPPITDLKNFILPLFPAERKMGAERMLATMKPATIQPTSKGLQLAIMTDVTSVYNPDDMAARENMTDEDLRRIISLWENWDGLLVYLITTLSKETLDDEEKRILTNLLLDTRYQFVNALSDRKLPYDFVRQQFVSAWQQMAPIFRRYLLQNDDLSMALGYLAFVSSADALLVFDRLGPTLGIEISTSGLIRLARMLNASPSLLQYKSDIDIDLQRLFQLEPGEPAPSPPPIDRKHSSLFLWLFEPVFISSACAAETVPSLGDLLQWKVPDADVADYLKRVEGILDTSLDTMISKGKVPDRVHNMFRRLIPAMAWQESCFRQFVVKGDKLTYLLSYNQSSVGLMQVNERVWRGLYSLERLRWDIAYNATAGSEIAALYLSKYALRDKDLAGRISDDDLARLVYAMYNGGPSQYNRFLERLKTQKFYDSDKLFWEKYRWVSAGETSRVSKCLIGR